MTVHSHFLANMKAENMSCMLYWKGLYIDSESSDSLFVTKLENVNTSNITFTHNTTDYTLAFSETELTGVDKYELYLDEVMYDESTSTSFSVAKEDLLVAKITYLL